jgi:hypothetical protein
VVVTRGFRRDPNLDLVDEASWLLTVQLDEERYLEHSELVANSFGGWVTTFRPPLPYQSALENFDTTWVVLQWREEGSGDAVTRYRAQLSVSAVLDLIPGQFHDWVVSMTEDAVRSLEGLVPEVADELDIDDRATLLDGLARLVSELRAAEDHRNRIRRRVERYYGQLYRYDFAPETPLYWWLDSLASGETALFVGPRRGDRTAARVFIPPDELTEWRWTAPEGPEMGGEYLTPAEALKRVAPEFRGWVASRTHEALQHVRHSLHQLGSKTLADPEDLTRIARLARHAASLAGFSQKSGMSYPGASLPHDEDHIAEIASADGRIVLLFDRTWRHILSGHEEMEHHLEALARTLEEPEFRQPDPRVGRERFFRRGGPENWLRVVIEVAGPVDRVVTAFPQTNAPERWGRL